MGDHRDYGRTNEEMIAKMVSQVNIRESKDECWNWTGRIISQHRIPGGRIPNLALDGGNRSISPIKVMYERFIGEFPEGYSPQRLCKNGLCLNPYHIKIGRKMTFKNGKKMRTNRPKSGDLDITLEEFLPLKDYVIESIAFFLDTDVEFVHRLYRKFGLKRDKYACKREYDGPEPYTPNWCSCDENARTPCQYLKECMDRFIQDEPLMCEATIYSIKEEWEEHEKLRQAFRVGNNGYH